MENEGYLVLFLSLGMATILGIFFFSKGLKTCPKCGQPIIKKRGRIIVCRQCGYLIPKDSPDNLNSL